MRASSRRSQSRVACHLQVSDDQGRVYELLDFTVEGMRLRGPLLTGNTRLTLTVESHTIVFYTAIVRQVAFGERWDMGVVVFGDAPMMSKLGFLAAALAHCPAESIRWLPYELLLSPQAAKETSDRIATIVLPERARRAMEASIAVHRRDRFVWQWAYEAIDATTLSCVPDEHRAAAIELKLVYAILATMLDDAVDLKKDRVLFDAVRSEIFSFGREAPAKAVYQPAFALWLGVRDALAALPFHHALAEWLRFDHETVAHGMAYSMLVNLHPLALNRTELHTWNVHSFFMLVFADIDLMFAPALEEREIGAVREVIMHAQQMCSIANWLGTWEREFRQRDLSSGVVSTAMDRQIFTLDELDEPTNTISLVRQAHVEEYWMAQWEHHWRAVDSLVTIGVFDKAKYLVGLERAYRLQMMGRGRL